MHRSSLFHRYTKHPYELNSINITAYYKEVRMDCPYCGQKMLPGLLYGRRDYGFLWLPKDAKPPLLAISERGLKKRRGRTFGEQPGVQCAQLSLYICDLCKKGVVDFTD